MRKHLLIVLIFVLAMLTSCIFFACEETGAPIVDDFVDDHTAHTYGNWTTVRAATCTATGSRERTCTYCGETQQGTTAALGHTYSEWIIETEATTSSEGLRKRHCTRCNDPDVEETEVIPIHQHSYGEWIIDIQPYCETAGSQHRVCSCGDRIDAVITAYQHDFTDTVTSPSCTESGYTDSICSRCTLNKRDRLTSPLGHSFDSNAVCVRCQLEVADLMAYTLIDNTYYEVSGMGSAENASKVILKEQYNLLPVKSIGYNAFPATVTEIVLCDSIEYIHPYALQLTTSLQYEIVDNARYLGNWLISVVDTDIATSIRRGTVGILESVFTDIVFDYFVIPSSVKYIGASAFYAFSESDGGTLLCEVGEKPQGWADNWNYNGNLEVIYGYVSEGIYGTISEDLQEDNRYRYCIVNKNGVNEVYLLEYMGNLLGINIPDEIRSMPVTYIANGAFRNCDTITHVFFSSTSNISKIGAFAFDGCDNLISVSGIPTAVAEIARNTFSNCTQLNTITLTSSITAIGDEAFYNCSALDVLVLPQRLISVGNSAFRYCSSLATLTLGEYVDYVGSYAFDSCTSLIINISQAAVPQSWDELWNASNCPFILIGAI